MEIDRALYNQYRDTPFKPEDMNNNQYNIKLGEKIKNPNMDEYVNYVLENTMEQEPSKNIKNSYNIILKTSLDKTKSINKSNNSLINNTNDDEANLNTANVCSKKDATLNFKMSKKFNDKKDEELNGKGIGQKNEFRKNNDTCENREETGNNQNVDMLVDEEDNENNFRGFNNRMNYSYDNRNKQEIYNNGNYYKAFNERNKSENNIFINQNGISNDIAKKIGNKKGKLPNIILTSLYYPKNDMNEKEGRFSKFINLFSFKKKKKQILKERNWKKL